MSRKDLIQYLTAVLMLLSGVVLAFWSFAVSHGVADSVLFYVAQCMIYAGSIFGVSVYMKSKLEELKKDK